jgi:eukaryotic-like serine/threonine-protein kinase
MPDFNLVGRTLGPYQIQAPLGSGGMAVVYRAIQTDLGRTVALKILPPELSLDGSYIARFMHEARSAAALEHPHIVTIYNVGALDGLHYIAMKYIQGETLKELSLREGALDVARAAGLLEQVAGALDYAHARGFIHRDIKPSNIMVERGGWLYLTDFGLARGAEGSGGLTLAGTVMGTPEYMSPEQAQGLATLTPASDIYALGVVLYELLTGHMPFNADTPMGMLVARLQYGPTPPRDYRGDMPDAVEDVVMRALARKPEARYASAGELVAALKRAAGLGSGTVLAPERPIATPLGLPVAPVAKLAPPAPAPQPATPPPPAPRDERTPIAATLAARHTPAPVAPPPVPASAPVAAAPEARRGGTGRALLIGAGVLLAILIVSAVLTVVSRQRSEAALAERLGIARTAFERPGGLDEALVAYREAAELDDDSAEAHTRVALIELLRDHHGAAQQAAEQAIDADGEFALAHAVLAEALNAQSEYEDALAAAEQAVTLAPELSQGYAVRATIKAARAARTDDQTLLDAALADAERAIELARTRENLLQAMAYNARGFVYWQQYVLTNDQSMADRGGDDFNRAIGLQPQIAVFHSNLGYFYNAQGSAALARGDEDGAAAKLDLARVQFENAQAADPEYGHAHAGLGWNLYYLKDYQGALGEFDKALELNAEDADALIGKSRVFLEQPEPDYPAAIEALESATEAAPHDPGVLASLGWAHMSYAFVQEAEDARESYAAAEDSFRQAIELNERSADALTGLGWALRGRAVAEDDPDYYEEAADALRQSLDIKPEQADAYFGLGWVSYGQEQYEAAEEAFRQAIELNPEDGGNHYWLGLTLQQLGRTDEARAAYQTAVEKGNAYAQEALDGLE